MSALAFSPHFWRPCRRNFFGTASLPTKIDARRCSRSGDGDGKVHRVSDLKSTWGLLAPLGSAKGCGKGVVAAALRPLHPEISSPGAGSGPRRTSTHGSGGTRSFETDGEGPHQAAWRSFRRAGVSPRTGFPVGRRTGRRIVSRSSNPTGSSHQHSPGPDPYVLQLRMRHRGCQDCEDQNLRRGHVMTVA